MIDGLDCTKYFKFSNRVPHPLRCPEGLVSIVYNYFLLNNKLKSLKVAKWRKDEMNEEWWWIKDEWLWFRAVEGFADRRTDLGTDICECRVAFAAENFG